MAPHFSSLAWKIPWAEEPGRLHIMESLRVRHDWATSLSLFTFMYWRRKWQPTPVFLAWRIPGTGEPGGLLSMGSHRVGHDWSDLAAAAYLKYLLGCEKYCLYFIKMGTRRTAHFHKRKGKTWLVSDSGRQHSKWFRVEEDLLWNWLSLYLNSPHFPWAPFKALQERL